MFAVKACVTKKFLKPSSAALLRAVSVSITLVACESGLAMSTCLDWSLLAKGSVTANIKATASHNAIHATIIFYLQILTT